MILRAFTGLGYVRSRGSLQAAPLGQAGSRLCFASTRAKGNERRSGGPAEANQMNSNDNPSNYAELAWPCALFVGRSWPRAGPRQRTKHPAAAAQRGMKGPLWRGCILGVRRLLPLPSEAHPPNYFKTFKLFTYFQAFPALGIFLTNPYARYARYAVLARLRTTVTKGD